MYDVKLNASLNHDYRMSKVPKVTRREPPRYLLPDGPVCAAPCRTRRLRDEATAIGLREACVRVRLTAAEAIGILTIFIAVAVSAALIGYANGVADATLRYTAQAAGAVG